MRKYIEQSVSDFECITNNGKKFKASDFNRLHDESLNFIKQSTDPEKSKVVIVLIIFLQFCAIHRLITDSPINEAFCVDLTDFIERMQCKFLDLRAQPF